MRVSASKERVRSCQAANSCAEIGRFALPEFARRSHTTTSRSGSLNGNGRSSTALTTLKIAVFAPMPSASVMTATAVNPGFFKSWRKANFRSFMAQCLHWIDLRRAAGGKKTGQQGDEQENYA